MTDFSEVASNYPFAVDVDLDAYSGPAWVYRLYRWKSGWLKAVEVTVETPVNRWQETLFACLTDNGLVISTYPASFLLHMPASDPMEVQHAPPEELDEIVDGLYENFLRLCDVRSERMLDDAQLDAMRKVESLEADYERLTAEIDTKRRAINGAIRDPRYIDQRDELQTKLARLDRVGQQLPALYRIKIRDARAAVEPLESAIIQSLGASGAIREIFTAHFTIRPRWRGRRLQFSDLEALKFDPGSQYHSASHDRAGEIHRRLSGRAGKKHGPNTSQAIREPVSISTKQGKGDETLNRVASLNDGDPLYELTRLDAQRELDARERNTIHSSTSLEDAQPTIDDAEFFEILQRDAERELKDYFDRQAELDADIELDDD